MEANITIIDGRAQYGKHAAHIKTFLQLEADDGSLLERPKTRFNFRPGPGKNGSKCYGSGSRRLAIFTNKIHL